MKLIAAVFALSTLAIGCGGNAADEAMSRMKTAKDKICACKDVACAEKAKDDFSDWGKANRDKLKDSKPSESFKEKFNKLEDEADACMDKLQEAAAPKPADPVVPPPTPSPDPTAPPSADPAAPPAAAPTPTTP